MNAWIGPFGFEQAFLGKFASATRRNTWYMKYKTCKQAGRTVDDYSIEFQQLWWKIDSQRAMPMESVLADYLSGLDPNVAMLVYGLAPLTLDDAIDKAKKVELGQMNASANIQQNARIQLLEQQNFILNTQLAQQNKGGDNKPSNNNYNKPPKPNTNRPGQNRGGGKGNGRNWNRPKDGQNNYNNNRNQDRNRDEKRCFRCGQTGHFIRDCLAENVDLNMIHAEQNEQDEELFRNPWEQEEQEVNFYGRTRYHLMRYNVWDDLRLTPTTAIFRDLMQLPQFREPIRRKLDEIE